MTTTQPSISHSIPEETICDLQKWAQQVTGERHQHRLRLIQAVDRARAGQPEKVADRGLPEASDTIYVIMRVSGKRFYSLSHELHDDAYSTADVITAGVDFLERGGKMRIVVEQHKAWESLQRSPFVRAMLDSKAENFSLMIAGKERKEPPHNFIVGDHFACRWEHDRKKYIGTSDFGDINQAEKTAEMFDVEWAQFGDDKFARQTVDKFRRIWRDAVSPQDRPHPTDNLQIEYIKKDYGWRVTSPQLPNMCIDIDKKCLRTAAIIENAASHLVSYKVGNAVRYKFSDNNLTLVR